LLAHLDRRPRLGEPAFDGQVRGVAPRGGQSAEQALANPHLVRQEALREQLLELINCRRSLHDADCVRRGCGRGRKN